MPKIYIEGSYGTVGSVVKEYLKPLESSGDIQIITLPENDRKNIELQKEAARKADLVVCCLPSSNSKDFIEIVKRENPEAKILDTSHIFRCDNGWIYGLPEITGESLIRGAKYIANPGCFATCCILVNKPLENLLPKQTLMSYCGFVGTSARGNKPLKYSLPMLIGFGREHKHIPEIVKHSGILTNLTTTVGDWDRGMLVQAFIPLAFDTVYETLSNFYAKTNVKITRIGKDSPLNIDPRECVYTNNVHIFLTPTHNCTSVSVVVDNLGKGAAGAAMQNIKLMMNIREYGYKDGRVEHV